MVPSLISHVGYKSIVLKSTSIEKKGQQESMVSQKHIHSALLKIVKREIIATKEKQQRGKILCISRTYSTLY